MRPAGFSYGAAYADLNNDGRLDLVVNNIDAPAFIYENVQRARRRASLARGQARGRSRPTARIGATLVLTAGGQKQHIYQSPYRGYMSTVDDRVHFGLGRAARVDSLEVVWPDGRYQVLTGLTADRLVTVKQSEATLRKRADSRAGSHRAMRRCSAARLAPAGSPYKHQRFLAPGLQRPATRALHDLETGAARSPWRT